MNNPELASLEASLQTLVRQAYDLGRRDALKKVVDMLNTERPGEEPLALMAPHEATQTPTIQETTQDMPKSIEAPPPPPVVEETSKPWWARR